MLHLPAGPTFEIVCFKPLTCWFYLHVIAGMVWRSLVDTSRVPPNDAMLEGVELLLPGADSYVVGGRTAIVFDAVMAAGP